MLFFANSKKLLFLFFSLDFLEIKIFAFLLVLHGPHLLSSVQDTNASIHRVHNNCALCLKTFVVSQVDWPCQSTNDVLSRFRPHAHVSTDFSYVLKHQPVAAQILATS